MQTFGIDVSRWQGDFNFTQAKAEGVKYAIIKCGGGDGALYTDGKFERNYLEARRNGLGVGAYFFGYAMTTSAAVKEADYCAKIIAGKQFDYPIFYDVEAARMDQGRSDTTAIVRAFCERLESYGYWVGFYTNLDWYNSKLDGPGLAARFSFWLAWWTAEMPAIDGVQMWQFGGETNRIRTNVVAGEVCDQSYCFVDFPAKIKASGKNGYADTMSNETEAALAKRWAIENKIFIGYNTGDYGWNDPLTREQMAILLYRLQNKLNGGNL